MRPILLAVLAVACRGGVLETRSDLAERTQALEQTVGVLQDRVQAIEDTPFATEAWVEDRVVPFDAMGERVDAMEAQGDAHTADIDSNSAHLASLEEELASSFLGMHWALVEWVPSTQERFIAQGAQGFPLLSAGGAFYLGGWVSATALTSNRVYWVTFYVTNLTGDDVAVSWDLCRGEGSELYLDDTLTESWSDLDGGCAPVPSFDLSPGSHKVQIRSIDSNNVIEGLGITNAWITDSGLEMDWASLRDAVAAGL